MDPHSIQLPREILVGKNVLESLPKLCDRLGLAGKALVLSDETTRKIAGDRIVSMLGRGTGLLLVNGASMAEVERVRKQGAGFVISAGGGTVIDVGKLAATRMQVPFISVPTAPSHDGIASERVSIHDGNARSSMRADAPEAIVADTTILREAPYRFIASGCADAISNYTAVHDWRLGRDRKGEYFSEYAASLSLLAAEIVMSSAELVRKREERGIRNLVEALVSSGIAMSMVDSSRPASGAEHMFSHALDRLGSNGLHGSQCGLGSIVTACLQGQDWTKVRASLKAIGSPVSAKELGINRDMFMEAFLKARDVRSDRYTVLDEIGFSEDKITKAACVTGVI